MFKVPSAHAFITAGLIFFNLAILETMPGLIGPQINLGGNRNDCLAKQTGAVSAVWCTYVVTS